MGALRRGCLYWAGLDKRRPVLVVSPDYRNERASDVIVVPCSSVVREAPTHVLLAKGEAGQPERSVLKCEQITTLRRDDLDGSPIGTVSPLRLRQVERAVMRAIGIPID